MATVFLNRSEVFRRVSHQSNFLFRRSSKREKYVDEKGLLVLLKEFVEVDLLSCSWDYSKELSEKLIRGFRWVDCCVEIHGWSENLLVAKVVESLKYCWEEGLKHAKVMIAFDFQFRAFRESEVKKSVNAC